MLESLHQVLRQGGPVMGVLMLLSVLLYAVSCHFLLEGRSRIAGCRRLAQGSPDPEALVHAEESLADFSRRFRLLLGSLVAAAPLLGLLGTVSGMSVTFAALSTEEGGRSMDGLARGISEVLLATEAGLCVALPGLVIIYLGHRQAQRGIQILRQAACVRKA